MNKQKIFLALVRDAICGQPLEDNLISVCTPKMLEEVYRLSGKHDLTHLVGQALSKMDIPTSEVLEKYKKAALIAFACHMQRSQEYSRICQVLDTAGIPYIPLKGIVLRDDYPEAWMRTSGDVDILVQPDKMDQTAHLLAEKLGYKAQHHNSDHDIALLAPSGVLLELHYETIGVRSEVNGCRCVLEKLWEHASPKEQGSSHLWLTDEMFYFYHMAHMAKHFAAGGCGVRSFLDVWVMNHRISFDQEKRYALLEEGGLLQFAQAAEKVSEVWFSGAEPTEIDNALSDYILRGGLYGEKTNQIVLGQAKSGNKLKYLLTRRIFKPYAYIKDEYPVLKKHKWLTPFYQVVRWFRILGRGGPSKAIKEVKVNVTSQESDFAAAEKLLKYLGI